MTKIIRIEDRDTGRVRYTIDRGQAQLLGPWYDTREEAQAALDASIIDSTILQVLAEADSDVEGRPLHDPIVRLVLARLRERRLRVSRAQVAARLRVILGGEP